jgi:DNA-binding transcriptional LysR family regulator
VVEKTAEIEKQILANELDIGMVSGTITNPPAFNVVHYLTDELVLIAPRNHPLAKQPRVSLKQIAKFPLILRDKGSLPRLIIMKPFAQRDFPTTV